MEIVEKAKVRLEIEDEEAKVSLESLKSEAKEINKELKALKDSGEVGSEAWKEMKNRQKEVNAEMKEFTSNIDINDASMNELRARSRQLSNELNKLKVDSEEWLEKLEELKLVDGRIKEVNAEMKEFTSNIDINNASMDELRARSRQLSNELNKLKVDSEEWLDKLEELKLVDGRIDAVKSAMKGLGDEVEKHGKEGGLWSNLKDRALGVFTGTALFDLAKEAGTAMLEFGKDIFETTAKFEKYDAVLTNALGSQEKAAAAMGDIKKFAAETPFSVDELTESYLKYVNRGLQPSMDEMRKMGDIAASQGKSFGQLTEAVLDAGTGEFERLKEFGIQASKSGDQVELSFKGVQKTVANTPEAIQGALLAFGELEGVAGGMASVSATLEGRVSNLGDNFDNLKILIGQGLKPVFGFLIDTLNYGIDVVKSLFDGTSPLAVLFDSMTEIFVNVWESTKALFATWLDGAKSSGYLELALESLTFAIKAMATAFLLGLTSLNMLLDGLNILLNKGKEVANFFGADFKIDPKANFDTLASNAKNNFGSIEKLWTDNNKKQVSATVATNAQIEKEHTKTQDKLTDKEKKELEKKAKAREKQAEKDKKTAEKLAADSEKAEAELQKKLENLRIKSIANELERKKAEINQKYDLEETSIKKSLASQATKGKVIANLAKAREAEIEKAESDARTKKELEDKKLRDKTAIEEKKQREQELKEEKALFDAEFAAEVAKAQKTLDFTKANSAEMWNAKRNLLETEWKYKQQQLQREADAEKKRAEESIADAEKRRAIIENIESRLKAKLSSEEQRFQQSKTKLNEEQNKQRQENNKQFFEGLNLAYKGDFNAFMRFLAEKVKGEKSANLKRLQDFSEKTQRISDAAIQGVDSLKNLNQNFLDSQLKKIANEKNAQIESWQAQYEAGKISKERFEAEKDKINTNAAAKERQARKDAFEREKKLNIAQATINTAQAALKSFATFGWPLGAVMAALAAVAGGVQIAAIARQKFEGRMGGVVNSEGKIFAKQGASVPKNAFVAQGDRHGSKYGEAGIAMINRRTGEEVGEIEGDEPVMVLSRNTRKNNGPIIDKLLHSSLYKNGAPITMEKGGILTVSGKRMYENGGLVGDNMPQGSTDTGKDTSRDIADIKLYAQQMRDMMKQKLTDSQKSKYELELLLLFRFVREEMQKQGITLEQIRDKRIDADLLHSFARISDNATKSNLA